MELSLSLTHMHAERDAEWINIAREYLEAKQSRLLAQAREERYYEQLKKLSQGVASKGGGYVFTPSYRLGSIDYKEIPAVKDAIQCLDLERYRKDSIQTWKLTYEITTEVSENV